MLEWPDVTNYQGIAGVCTDGPHGPKIQKSDLRDRVADRYRQN